jgi:hypothetical protein
MGYTSSHEICNLALIKMGHEGSGITAAQLATPTDEVSRKCNVLYEPSRDYIMSSFPWKFAMKRAIYDIDDYIKTVTSITAATPPVLTAASHGIAEGRGVYLYDTGDSDYDEKVWVATSVGTNVMTLYKLDGVTAVPGVTYGAQTAGYIYPAPLQDYEYEFALPSDYLAMHIVGNGHSEYEIEGGYLQIGDTGPEIRYIAKITTVSKYSTWFIQSLACYLAAELAGSLAGKLDMKKALMEELYRIILPRAQQNNAFEADSVFHGFRYDPDNRIGWQKAGR